MNLICNICPKITLSRLLLHIPGANDLIAAKSGPNPPLIQQNPKVFTVSDILKTVESMLGSLTFHFDVGVYCVTALPVLGLQTDSIDAMGQVRMIQCMPSIVASLYDVRLALLAEVPAILCSFSWPLKHDIRGIFTNSWWALSKTSWKFYSLYKVNIIADDALAMQGARSSAVIIFT